MIFRNREDEVVMITKDVEIKLFNVANDEMKLFCKIIIIFLNKKLRSEDSMTTMNLFNITILNYFKELIDDVDFIAFS